MTEYEKRIKIAEYKKDLASYKEQHRAIDLPLAKNFSTMTKAEITREKDKLKPLAKEIQKLKNKLSNLGVAIDE